MRRNFGIGAFVLVSAFGTAARAAQGVEGQDLSNLSIEQLANIHVRSVSKRDQPLADAPASLYVIDHDQIVRSGALTIPEILRLAPNIQVYQQSPAHWVATARGLNGNPAAQSFSNKLLVLIDGRTVYTPLFSGVYWDLPDLVPDDIERIEVISGPGATLWGANAVNGVINIITRKAGSSPGAYANVEAGTSEQVAGIRFSGHAGAALGYRVYGRWLNEDSFDLRDGGSAHDGWNRLGGGFRVDWQAAPQDTVAFQGDIFGGRENQLGASDEKISGHDVVVRWLRQSSRDRQLQVQAFYDHFRRDSRPDGGSFFADTFDLDLQHSFPIGSRNTLVWGGGARIVHYRIDGTPQLFFAPSSRNLFLANAFVQDTFAISDRVSLTGGLKAERDPYVGTSLLPDVRLSIKPTDSTLVWGAVSHAVRSPTPFDEDVQERILNIVALSGNPQFRTEKLTAYELGLRAQPLSALSFSATGFYHHYDDLRTVELGTGPATLNLYWGNGLAGHSYGVDAWASTAVLPWWTISAGATVMAEHFHFKPGASGLVGTWQNGLDPSHRFTFRSSMNFGEGLLLDLNLRALGRLKHSDVPAYAELDGRVAWNVSDHLTLSVTAANLLHSQHVEYPGGDEIPRKVLLGLQWHP
jgi:iron complex outermembrane receptor protein